jgi:2,4-dienoyl-CoA reductase-like NADH-dependent reductase (Old Yellow Enzyme family)/thioredoxin reductase
MPAGKSYPHIFEPTRIGPMRLRSRVMIPPHFSAIGNLWGSDADAERALAYLEERAGAGAAWITITGRVGNHFIAGFEPSGMSAETLGYFRLPHFSRRMEAVVSRLEAHDTRVVIQMTMIGGYPHAPSDRLSNTISNARPHVLTGKDIETLVEEYRFSARQVRSTGLAGVEMHFNHDDLVEWFMSPLTNARTDRYGGSRENRLRLAVEILTAAREELGKDRVLGVRLNAFEEMPGGYDAAEGIEIARHLAATGLVDYLSITAGSNWGSPSYIQTHYFDSAQWADMAGAIRRTVPIPVVYAGLVDGPDAAERILAAGNADVVGIARAHAADGHLLRKAREGRPDEIRPCIAANDCINRRYVDGLPFGCAVNPHASREVDGPWPKASKARDLLVVGGGPAGMELAALAAESGHRVRLWEAAADLGGQLNDAIRAPGYERMASYLAWQKRRLARLGVAVETNRQASADEVLRLAPDVVALATGARPHRPDFPGVADAQEARDVLAGRATPGRRVAIVAGEDHMQPLALADFLSSRGHEVTLIYGTQAPAILLGRYSVGAPLARLDSQGARIRVMEQVVGVHPRGVDVRNIYSKRSERLDGFDTVVLACGGSSDSTLFEELSGKRQGVHVLGDAYAPRRLVFATRQAYALARLLATTEAQ